MGFETVDNVRTGTASSPAMGHSRDDLTAMFRRMATEVVERDFHHVAESTVISELGIDSLGMLEIIGSMERELKIQIPDESLSGISTVKDLIEVVHQRLSEK